MDRRSMQTGTQSSQRYCGDASANVDATHKGETMPGLIKGNSEWSHPLITIPEKNFSRRHLIGISGGAIAGLTLLPSIKNVAAQSTPEPSGSGVTGDADAVELLRKAVQAMTELETFHFFIETTSGETKIMDILEIEEIEGDVRRPYDFQTTVQANLFMGNIDITAVGVDGKVQIEDPTSTTGAWIDLGTDAATLSLLNPDYLFLSAVGILQETALAGEEDFEGESARKVTGLVSFPDVADQISAEEIPLPTELSTDPVEVTLWINESDLILGIEFLGAVLETESPDVTRLITFSAFNEPVEIEQPE